MTVRARETEIICMTCVCVCVCVCVRSLLYHPLLHMISFNKHSLPLPVTGLHLMGHLMTLPGFEVRSSQVTPDELQIREILLQIRQQQQRNLVVLCDHYLLNRLLKVVSSFLLLMAPRMMNVFVTGNRYHDREFYMNIVDNQDV